MASMLSLLWLGHYRFRRNSGSGKKQNKTQKNPKNLKQEKQLQSEYWILNIGSWTGGVVA
jgi:hypothetical protein